MGRDCSDSLILMNRYSGYSPGCSVSRWMPDSDAIDVIIHDREYYIGKGDEKGLHCEKWGKASREFAETMPRYEIVGAFVPYP